MTHCASNPSPEPDRCHPAEHGELFIKTVETLSDSSLMQQIAESRDFYRIGKTGLLFDDVFGEPIAPPEKTPYCVRPFRSDIPPHVAEAIRSLHPDLKRSIKSAIRAIAVDPECGDPLLRDLDGLRKFPVRRFRIIYAIERGARNVPSWQSAIANLSTKNSPPGFAITRKTRTRSARYDPRSGTTASLIRTQQIRDRQHPDDRAVLSNRQMPDAAFLH